MPPPYLPPNMSGPAAKPRVTVVRCKPCANPYDADGMPRHLPAGSTQYVLHAFATKSLPYHVTIDVAAKITGHQCVRGRGGAIVVLYEPHWDGLLRPTWKRQLDLQTFRHHIFTYWTTGPTQHQPHTRQYQQLRIKAAARGIARTKGERHLPGSYRLVLDDVYGTRFMSDPLPVGASICYHSFDGSWWLGKVKQPPNDSGRYVIRSLDNPGPALIALPGSTYKTVLHAPCGSWCLQTHGRSNPLQGVLHGLPTPWPYTRPQIIFMPTPRLLCLHQCYLYLRQGLLYQCHGSLYQRRGLSSFRYYKVPRSSVYHSNGFLPIPELQFAL